MIITWCVLRVSWIIYYVWMHLSKTEIEKFARIAQYHGFNPLFDCLKSTNFRVHLIMER